MRGAGIDSTALFDEFHAWVNIDQLLEKCYIGPLKSSVSLNLRDSSTKLSPPSSSSIIKFHSILSVSSEALSKGFFAEKLEMRVPPQPIEIIPRFDWIQKTSEISVYFYTKSFCNPGIEITSICDQECEIKILIANTLNLYKFSFLKPLRWPCTPTINQETGKNINLSYIDFMNK
jgi:cytochrome-b5 reductase